MKGKENMKAEKLVGKLAIRTKPLKFGEDRQDYSYTSEPIRIVKVTENHIVTDYKGTKHENIFRDVKYVLDERWLDDNWIDYEELISEDNAIKKTITVVTITKD